MLLPPNVTAVLQPMDQNPIRLVKLAYRTKLLCGIVAQDNVSVEDLLKAHDIRKAISLLRTVWDELSQSVLQNAWKKIKNWDESEYNSEDDTPLSKLNSSVDVYNAAAQEVQSLLAKLKLNTDLSLEEIGEWNADKMDEENALSGVEESDIEIAEQIPTVSYSEAIESVNKLIKWCDYHNDTNQMSYLFELRTKIVKTFLSKPKKQTSLTNYFESL